MLHINHFLFIFSFRARTFTLMGALEHWSCLSHRFIAIFLSNISLSNHHRLKLRYPVLILVVNIIMSIKCLLSIYIYLYYNKLSDLYFVYLSDLDHFLKTGFTMNLTLIMVSLFSMALQLVNYYNYRNGIKPTDLRVFQMICGLITPKSIKITNSLLVHKLSIISNTFI